jgi:hypothetical protein
MNVLAIIADIVQSKAITDRKQFQIGLEKILGKINKQSKNYIVSPYTITLGDEFQAVYRDSESLFFDIWEIIAYVYPYKLRFAVGHDQIVTKANKQKALGMDGPAFHSAREGLAKMKKYNMTLVQFFGEELPSIELINNTLLLIAEIVDKWKKNTNLIMRGLLQNRGVDKIAAELSITERAVYKNINTNYVKRIIELQKNISCMVRIGGDMF